MHPVSCLEDAMKLLQKGCQLRSRGETAMNDKSSRSHAIFTLCIEGNESEERFKLLPDVKISVDLNVSLT